MATDAHDMVGFRHIRGQTAIDFLAGMTVFLVTIGFVLSFVPGMFQPFETDTGANMVAADRGAALLVEDALVEGSGTPGVLNETCTAEFFDADGDTDGCRFADDADDLPGALGLDELREVNVTIESGGSLETLPGDAGSVTTAGGPAPASTDDVIVATRVVLVDGRQATLYVRVW